MKRFFSFVLFILVLTLYSIPAYAKPVYPEYNQSTSASQVSPYFIAIAILSSDLSIDANGYATATGSVRPSNSSYTTNLTVNLQKYTSNGWITVKSWSGGPNTGLSGTVTVGHYYVGSGTYRSATTASVYNSTGSVIETATAYSSSHIF